MRKLSLDEPEAHRRLQLESQKRRVPLVDLAKKIIEAEELLGGGEAARGTRYDRPNGGPGTERTGAKTRSRQVATSSPGPIA
jgi:hypothetical protein